MKTPTKPIRYPLLLLSAGGLALLLACSAVDEPSSAGRIESPAKVSPMASWLIPSSSPSASNSSPMDVHPGPPYPRGKDVHPAPPFRKPSDFVGVWPPPPSQWWGLKLTPLERLIADTCPEQPWSQNVPDIDCTNDDECGDGFCDRGYCERIWTCAWGVGQRCDADKQCGGLCIEGRCRSCISNAECETKLSPEPAVCNHPYKRGPDRFCGIYAPKHRHGDRP
jgi:hypothetical protein